MVQFFAFYQNKGHSNCFKQAIKVNVGATPLELHYRHETQQCMTPSCGTSQILLCVTMHCSLHHALTIHLQMKSNG